MRLDVCIDVLAMVESVGKTLKCKIEVSTYFSVDVFFITLEQPFHKHIEAERECERR